MKSTVCSGVQAAAGFSCRPCAVSGVKTKPGIKRCAVMRQPAVLRSSCASASVKAFTPALETLGGVAGRRGDALLGAGVDDQPRPAARDHGGCKDLRAVDDPVQID